VLNPKFNPANSILQQFNAPCLGNTKNIYIKRDDLIHPIVSGNKWRKLEFAIEKAKAEGKNHLATFGGAYSNHMLAAACAGAVLGLKTSCFLRGDELSQKNNHYLFLAKLYGMELIPVSRDKYRLKNELFDEIFGEDSKAYFISEGGESEEGLKGVAKIIAELDFVPDHIIHASATGTTALGLAKGLLENSISENQTKIFAVAVLKNAAEQLEKIENKSFTKYISLIEGFECGGYAKTTPELLQFCKDFIRQTGIIIDPVYTGKALFALKEMISNGTISEDKKTVFLHTGGMMGIFSDKFMSDFK